LIDIVRKVKLKQLADQEVEIQQTKVSLGKSIISELTGANTLPDEVSVTLPVFDNFSPSHKTIRLALEVEPSAGKFQLIPFPGQIEQAYQEIETDLGAMLRDGLKDVAAVHFGKL
jgi:hypothetical protein